VSKDYYDDKSIKGLLVKKNYSIIKNLFQFTTEYGNAFFIEIPDDITLNEPVRGSSFDESNRGIIQNTIGSFEKALIPLKEISSIINSVKKIAKSPEDINIELG